MVGRTLSVVNERLGRRALIWAAILAVLALVLNFIPLFNLLGFDFSFAIGLAAAWAAVDIGQGVVAHARRQGGLPLTDETSTPAEEVAADTPTATVARLALRAVTTALATLAAPLLLSLANMVRVQNCNVTAGLAFFGLLPVATVMFAAPAGVLAGLFLPRRGRLLALALPLLSIAWTLWRMYRDPAVFAFDPFGGYFPGPIYDEALRPPVRLLYFRLTNLVWIAAAVALASAAWGRALAPRRWRRRATALALPLLVVSAVLFGLRGQLGFHVRHQDVLRLLDGELRTAHFVLRYARATGKTRADLALAAEDLEFRYEQLRNILGIEPRGSITIYEFPSAEVKKSVVGAAYTLYAKPWTRELFLQTDRFPSRRLRHEMAHVFAGAFGDPVFGISLSWRWKGPLPLPTLASGLVEGIAEAADSGNPDGASTVHQDARAIVADGRAPPLKTIVGAGFTTVSGPRAYTLAGSFCAFLLETRGAEKLRRLYRSAGNFIDVYRTPLANLEQEWRQFLERQPLSARDRARASEQFRRPAIFKKVCARELAARVGEARGLLRTAPAEAVRILQRTCDDDPHEPTFRIELAEAWAATGERGRALEALGRLANQADLTAPLRARIASSAGEIYFHAGDFANVAAEQTKVLQLATEEADRRVAYTRHVAAATPAARATLGRVVYGNALREPVDAVLSFFLLTEYARLFPADRLGPYLVGRQLLGRDPAAALPYLRRACEEEDDPPASQRPSPLTPDFLRECRRMIVDAGYRVGDFPRARAALRRLVATAETEAERLRSLDMEERLDWVERQRASALGAR